MFKMGRTLGRKLFVKRATLLCLSLLVSANGIQSANARDGSIELKKPSNSVRQMAPRIAPSFYPDILLVMPNAKADADETSDALREAHGTVIGTFGEDELLTWIVRVEKGKLAEAERKLKADKHFSAVQRDYAETSGAKGTVSNTDTPNDPQYPAQWHMIALQAQEAWQRATGKRVTIAIADSGCQESNPDLAGKTFKGVDVVNGKGFGNFDRIQISHGTCAATCAAASSNNSLLTAAPARDAKIYPIDIATPTPDGHAVTTDVQVGEAILEAGKKNIRIINISYGAADANYSFANAAVHPVVHKYLQWYHDKKNGMAFFSAGNAHQFDPNPRLPYLIMVSAMDESYGLAEFSNAGNPIWFTAPGQNIVCSDRNGRVVHVDGTSFASPLVASIAALVISEHPSWSNLQVEHALIKSCSNSTAEPNTAYGFGLPSAAAAVAL